MTRFYLDLLDGSRRVEDEEGRKHPNMESAKQEAIRALKEILAAEIASGVERRELAIEIRSGAERATVKAVATLHITS